MINEEQLNKVIDLYERSYMNNGVCVYVNNEAIDVDLPSIWLTNDILYFEFNDDEVNDLCINTKNINEIAFDVHDSISIIKIDNSDVILIHNM
jgi:hypothetical protein